MSWLDKAVRALSRQRPDAPSFAEGPYIVGSADLVREHRDRRRDRGQANFADDLLAEVAHVLELRHDANRREEGEVELRAALLGVAACADSWIAAIDRRSG